MNALIESVVKEVGKVPVVRFRFAAGTGLGLWGARSEPIPGNTYSVELDVSVALAFGANTELTSGGPSAVSTDADTVLVRGEVESIDEDGMLFLRLAPDCLVMIESEGGFQSGTWIEVTLHPTHLELTPL